MIASSFALAAATLAVPVAAGPAEIAIAGVQLRLGDLAALDGFEALGGSPHRARTIAALPAGRERFVTTRGALAALAQRRFPALRLVVARGGDEVAIRRPPPARPVSGCFESAAPITTGAAVTPADVSALPCRPGQQPALLRFDRRAGLATAARAIDAGTYLGRLALPPAAGVAPGGELTLISSVGSVTISRPVVALQAGRSGSRLFVRDADGEVFSVSFTGRVRP
jgi:hypothetical protein